MEADEQEDAPARAMPVRRLVGFVVRALLRHPFLLAATLLAAIGVASAEVVSISLVLPFLDTLRGDGGTLAKDFPLSFLVPRLADFTAEEKIRFIAIGLLLVQVVRGVLSYVESRIASFLKIILERDLRQMVFDELLRVELRFIHKERAANLYTILHTYPRQAADIADQYLGSVSKTIIFATYVWMMLLVSWELTLLAVVLGGTSMIIVGRMRFVLRRLGRRINESRVRLNQVTLESLTAMKVIRLFAREDYAQKRFLDEVRGLQRESYKRASLSALAAPLQRVVNMGLFAALLVAATFVIDKSSDDWLLLLTLFILVIVRLMGPLASLTRKRTRIASELPALEMLIEFVERPKPKLVEGARSFTRLREGVRFDRVSFAYDEGAPVLRDVSFHIPRGRTVALVGASGSGKSTLVHLLARLSDPTSGRVLVDGDDLRSYRSTTWRRRVAVVSQDTFLFNDSVRENIRFGRLDATDAEVEEAARRANAHEFILEMEDGYGTIVGDRGVRLSGGQAQRLAIARALLADPDVLVLDEATSALDTATERQVQQAIEAASRDRTVVAVAHRLSTVRRAHEILVLDAGRVVERGTHDQLLAHGGRYAELVRMQDLAETGEAADAPADAPAPAAPPGPRIARVVLSGAGRAVAAYDDGTTAPLRVVVATNGHVPHEEGTVVLRPGAARAEVRLGGTHDDVPLYSRQRDGSEIPLRVAPRP